MLVGVAGLNLPPSRPERGSPRETVDPACSRLVSLYLSGNRRGSKSALNLGGLCASAYLIHSHRWQPGQESARSPNHWPLARGCECQWGKRRVRAWSRRFLFSISKSRASKGHLLVDLYQCSAIKDRNHVLGTGRLGTEPPMRWFFENPLPNPTRPVCSKCGALMWLIRIEPEKPDCARRTFECPRCENRISDVITLEKAA